MPGVVDVVNNSGPASPVVVVVVADPVWYAT
jgi:hypothetical protein